MEDLLEEFEKSLLLQKSSGATSSQPLDKTRASLTRFLRYFGQEICYKRPFYNFGSGNWCHPLFQNIDLVDPGYPLNIPDIEYDAFEMQELEIPENTAYIFYISHVNEHLPDEKNAFIMKEIFRCLRPGGVLRIVYPDVDVAYQAYLRDDREFALYDWFRGDNYVEIRDAQPTAQHLLDFFATRAQKGSPNDGNIKYTAQEYQSMLEDLGLEKSCDKITQQMLEQPQRDRPNTHMNWWNHSKMERFLKDAGFKAIIRSAYQQSTVPPLRDTSFFDFRVPHMSGYVECIK